LAGQSRQSGLGGAIAGAGIGMLVGIATSFSSAPVTAVVVGAISAGLLVLLGFQKGDASAENAAPTDAGAVARVAAFGIACSVALVAGLVVRTHDLLAPTPAQTQQKWKDAGFTDEQARQIALYEKSGLTLNKGTGKEGDFAANRSTSAGTESTLLFATRSGSPCPYFDKNNYATTGDMLQAMELQGGALQKFAVSTEKLSAGERDDVVNSVGGLLCAP